MANKVDLKISARNISLKMHQKINFLPVLFQLYFITAVDSSGQKYPHIAKVFAFF